MQQRGLGTVGDGKRAVRIEKGVSCNRVSLITMSLIRDVGNVANIGQPTKQFSNVNECIL